MEAPGNLHQDNYLNFVRIELEKKYGTLNLIQLSLFTYRQFTTVAILMHYTRRVISVQL